MNDVEEEKQTTSRVVMGIMVDTANTPTLWILFAYFG